MAEKEYIEREAVINFANNHITKSLTMNDIARFPAADVEPVRHGHWISQDNNIFKCSECDYEFEHEGYIHFFNFCPNCGTKMDGGEGK